MEKYRIIDADAHLVEHDSLWQDYLDPEFRSMGPRLVSDGNGQTFRLLGDQIITKSRHTLDTPEKRLKAMDGEGIEAAMLYPSVGLFFSTVQRLDLCMALCRAYNNYASDYCKASPSRLYASAMVPQLDVFETLKEARRAVVELGAKGVFLRPNPIGGRNLEHPAWEPLWNLLEELDTPLVLHEGTNGGVRNNVPQVGVDRYEHPLFVHAVSHPMEHMMAMLSLICGGVLDRHPKLRVVHVEAGCGWVPYWLERLDHHVAYKSYGRDAPSMQGWSIPTKVLPSEYFKRQCLVSADPEENTLQYVVGAVGDGNFAFSTDFPHADHQFVGMAAKLANRPELSEQAKRKILGTNAAQFFGI